MLFKSIEYLIFSPLVFIVYWMLKNDVKNQTIILQLDPNSVFDLTYNGDEIKLIFVKYPRNKTIKSEIKKHYEIIA